MYILCIAYGSSCFLFMQPLMSELMLMTCCIYKQIVFLFHILKQNFQKTYNFVALQKHNLIGNLFHADDGGCTPCYCCMGNVVGV
jgi:hypothetical protein